MTIVALLNDLTPAGVRLTLVDDHIEADAPEGALTPALLADLRIHKPDLLEILIRPAGPCPRCGSAVLVELTTGPTVCPGCCTVALEAVTEKLVWNSELAGVEPYAEALGAARAERTTPRARPAPTPADDAPRCDRCGATAFRDVPIHAGESVRRDCLACRRFLSFPTWYGENTDPEDAPR